MGLIAEIYRLELLHTKTVCGIKRAELRRCIEDAREVLRDEH